MSAGWCPWCGAELDPPPPDERCPVCKGKTPAGSLLASRPPVADPKAVEAAGPTGRAPEGGTPLPPGSPVPTTEGNARFVAWILLGVILFGLLARFVAAPALQRVRAAASPNMGLPPQTPGSNMGPPPQTPLRAP